MGSRKRALRNIGIADIRSSCYPKDWDGALQGDPPSHSEPGPRPDIPTSLGDREVTEVPHKLMELAGNLPLVCSWGACAIIKEIDSGQTTDFSYRELHTPREGTKG